MGVVLVVLQVMSWKATGGDFIPGIRRIPIWAQDSEYRRFPTQLIDTREKFDAFVKRFNTKNEFDRAGKDDYPAFIKTLVAARIDFDKEVLMLYRLTEPSSSTPVYFWMREGRDGTIDVTIYRENVPCGVLLLGEYCFAFTVSKKRAGRLVFWELTRLHSLELPVAPSK